MDRFSQRIALVCGGLCLAVALLLVLVSHLSSRYILEQQRADHSRSLIEDIARDVAPVLAQGDLIRLESMLRSIQERHKLRWLSVLDLDERPLGHAGEQMILAGRQYRQALTIGDHVAGELILVRGPDAALDEQRHMSLGLLFLAVLASLFVAVLAGRWGYTIGQRLQALRDRLTLEEPGTVDEIASLEAAVQALPIELINSRSQFSANSNGDDNAMDAGFQEAGLLFIRLHSLARYVETLDENSLLQYTHSLQAMTTAVAGLYGGKLSVSREFGLTLIFSGDHAAGGSAFRCVSSAWLLQRLARELGTRRPLQFDLGLACAPGEANRDPEFSPGEAAIYPDLYNQHVLNDLAVRTESPGNEILVADSLASDDELSRRCEFENGDGWCALTGFEEPYADQLGRQYQLLLRELAG
jgi:hypothetical protein